MTKYEVTNREETVGLTLEQAAVDDRRRPYVDIVDTPGKAERYSFTSRQAALSALGEWLLRYQPAYQEANPFNLRVFAIRQETVREEVA